MLNHRKFFFDEIDYIKYLGCVADCYVSNYSNDLQEIPSDSHCFFSYARKYTIILTPSEKKKQRVIYEISQKRIFKNADMFVTLTTC